ncbi:MAG TPA: hypothetical protein VLX89_07775 [Actinomycetota bacterium]|nr:hypothetical protein [Actinomycetota bacterium]
MDDIPVNAVPGPVDPEVALGGPVDVDELVPLGGVELLPDGGGDVEVLELGGGLVGGGEVGGGLVGGGEVGGGLVGGGDVGGGLVGGGDGCVQSIPKVTEPEELSLAVSAQCQETASVNVPLAVPGNVSVPTLTGAVPGITCPVTTDGLLEEVIVAGPHPGGPCWLYQVTS